MKQTDFLGVKTSLYLQNEILIHPNEGFDLDLMNTAAHVKIFADVPIQVFNKGESDYIEGKVTLDNKATPGVITLSNKYWKKIGSPEKVQLFYEDNKLLIAGSK